MYIHHIGMVGGRRDSERDLGGSIVGSQTKIQDVGDIRQFSGANVLFS
jgi:hypothetical protein